MIGGQNDNVRIGDKQVVKVIVGTVIDADEDIFAGTTLLKTVGKKW